MNRNFFYGKYFEVVLIVFLAVVLILACVVDFSSIKSPFIIKVNQPEDLFNALFTVQASVATISIAVVALISGFVSESIYGISVSNYIMELRPKYLKHKLIIIFNFFSILLNYFLISNLLYYVAIALFISTITFSIKMVNDISSIFFYGKQNLKDEIENYVTNYYDKNLLSKLCQETNAAITSNNSLTVIDDVTALSKIFKIELQKCSQTNITDELEYIQVNFADIFMTAYLVYNSFLNLKLLNMICSLYEEANKKGEYPIPLKIWDDIYHQFFKAIGKISLEELQGNDIIFNYRKQLYKNLNIELKKGRFYQINCFGLEYYTLNIYDSIFKNQNKIFLNDSICKSIKKSLYDDLYSMLDHNFQYQNNYKVALLQKELCNYIKVLINNDEHEILQDKLFISYQYYYSDNYTLPIFSCLIYLYYLAYREDLASNKLQEIAKNILDKNNEFIIQFIYDGKFDQFEMEDCDFLHSQLKFWEIMPKNSAKDNILDNTIDDFLIFSALRYFWDRVQLYSFLKIIVKEEPFPLYERYFSHKDSSAKKDFILFSKKIFNEDASGQVDDKFGILKDVLDQIYTETEIKKGIEQELPAAKLQEYSDLIQKIMAEQSSQLLEKFPKFIDVEPLTEECSFKSQRLTTLFIKSQFSQRYIIKFLQNNIIGSLLKIVKEHLKIKEVHINCNKKQEQFLEKIKESEQKIDTIIGNRRRFIGEEESNEFNELMDHTSRIQFPDGDNVLYAIDHHLLYMKFTNIDAKLEDLSDDDIIKISNKDADGHIFYKVANDIYIPFDDIDTLRDHVHRTTKRICISATVEYKIAGDIIGAGIEIQ